MQKNNSHYVGTHHLMWTYVCLQLSEDTQMHTRHPYEADTCLCSQLRTMSKRQS